MSFYIPILTLFQACLPIISALWCSLQHPMKQDIPSFIFCLLSIALSGFTYNYISSSQGVCMFEFFSCCCTTYSTIVILHTTALYFSASSLARLRKQSLSSWFFNQVLCTITFYSCSREQVHQNLGTSWSMKWIYKLMVSVLPAQLDLLCHSLQDQDLQQHPKLINFCP